MGGPSAVAGPVLLERDAELAAVDAALAAAARGDGRLVLVEGAPGAGKTALVREARALARTAGHGVLTARGTPLESASEFGVVRQLLSRPAAATRVGDASTAAARALLLEEATAAPAAGAAPFALFHSLFWLLASLADARPLLLAVDDAHWADAPSLDFLRFLVTRIDDLPVVLLVATRPPSSEEAGAALAQLDLDPDVALLRPAPLTRGAVRQILAARLGEPDEEFVAACHDATGGNPFFLAQLVLALQEDAVRPVRERSAEVAAVGPARVSRWALRRVAELPQEAGRLARAVAVLGDDAELRTAARLARLDQEAATDAAVLLERADIVEAGTLLRFRHPIMAAAIYEEMPAAQRASAHGRAARLLAAEDARERAAVHHLRSDARGDATVVALLRDAAARARSRGVPDAAVSFLRRALDEPPAPADRPLVLRELGAAELHAGDAQAAEDHLREAGEAVAGDTERADAAVALGRALAYQGRWTEATAMVDAVRGALSDPGGEAAMLLDAMHLQLKGRIDLPRDLRMLERYAHLEGRTPSERALLIYLGTLRLAAGGPLDDALALIRRGLRDGSAAGPGAIDIPPWQSAVSVIYGAELFDEALRHVDRALEDARRHGAVYEFALASALGCAICARSGDLAAAETHGRTGLDALAGGPWRGGLDARLAHVLTLRGEWDEAERLLAPQADEAGPPDWFTVLRIGFRGELRRLQGRLDEAVEDLRAAVRMEGDLAARTSGAFSMRHQLVLALAPTAPEEALELAREDLARSREHPRAGGLGVSLWALAVAEGGAEGIARLRDAVGHLGRSPLRLHHAEALTDLGAALRRAGARAEARDHLRRAADIALACDAAPLAERAAQELRATGARPRRLVLRGADSLTPMERRIATLAADGLTNPQIAQVLFVTRKNVEAHLSRAYAKLDIGSRAELPAALARAQS